MKRSLIVYICLVALILISLPSLSSAAVSDNAREAAEQALDSYKQMLKGTDFEFHSEKEFQQAKVGNHMLPIYRIDGTMLSKGPNTFSDVMYSLNLVEFTINSNGKTVTRMTMKKNGETYSRNGFGGLGGPMVRGLDAFPSEAQPHVKLVKLGALEFLYVGLNGQELITYITPMSISGIEQNRVYTADQAIPKLQQIATYMIEHANEDGGVGSITIDTIPTTNAMSTNLKVNLLLFSIASILILAGGVYYYRKKRVSN